MDLFLPNTARYTLTSFVILAGSFVTVCYCIGILSIVLMTIFSYVTYQFYYWIGVNREIRRMENNEATPIYNHLTETYEGLDTILLSNRQKYFIQENYTLMDSYKQCRENQIRSLMYVQSRWELAVVSFTLFVCFACIQYASLWPAEFSNSFAALAISMSIQINLSYLTSLDQYTRFEIYLANMERILHLGNLIEEEQEENYQDMGSGLVQNWPSKGEIKVKDAFFKFKDMPQYVLKELNLTIQPKDKVAILGRTGCGKSTLVLGLLNLVKPLKGSVEIDNLSHNDLGGKFWR